jgi:hypothetical protein
MATKARLFSQPQLKNKEFFDVIYPISTAMFTFTVTERWVPNLTEKFAENEYSQPS